MSRTPSMEGAIYLDYNATTPCDRRVVEAMLPYFTSVYGNPANGLHAQGRQAARAISNARAQVATLIGAEPEEIVFTSGATESNNLAILGLARAAQDTHRNHIVTSAVEHKAVLLPAKQLASEGYEVTVLPVNEVGMVRIEDVRQAISDRTLLVTIQTANNEIGTLQPIEDIVSIAHDRGALVHTDAAQAVGKIPVDVQSWGVNYLSASAHKLYGPKGVGFLYMSQVARHTPMAPLSYGGGQERNLRSGTLNVPGIVGLGEACRICCNDLAVEIERISQMRLQFEAAIRAGIPDIRINADGASRLPNTTSLMISGVAADALLINLPELMLGTGSACTSGALQPSHVLEAIGLSREDAYSTIRVSLGRFTSPTETDKAAFMISRGVGAQLRSS